MGTGTTTMSRRLGDLLVDKGYISDEQLRSALERQREGGRDKLLGEVLVELEYCSEDQIVECLAAEYGVPYAKLDARLYDPKIVDVLPREYVENNLVLPLFVVRNTLTIAVSEPSNLFLIDEVRGLSNLDVQIVAATPKDIRRMLTSLPNSKVFVIDDIIEDSETADVTLIEEAIEDIGDVEEIAGQSPVIRLVNYIIFNAVKEGASDVHVEAAERCLRVRYRIDGRLHKSLEVPQHLLNAVTSRIKIMASLDISERRLPQDGRVNVLLEGRKIDLRVSTFPTSRGEKTVIRVLDTRTISLNLEDLGFAEKGKGPELIREKQTYHDGSQPVNVDGGLKAKGHPVGATGVSQATEIVKQLRGQAEEGRQVDGAEVGLVHNVGGIGQYCFVHIFRR